VPVFIGLAMANFLLPEASRRRQEGLPAGRALVIALAFVVAPGLFLAGLGAVAARPLLTLVFGPSLTAAAPALWVLALAMTCLAVSLMFATYLLGAGVRKVVVALGACAVLTALGLAAAGGGMLRTASAGLGCQAVTAVAVGALVFRLHHAGRRSPAAQDAAARDLATVGDDPVPARV
jgi:O-antigen/teichoic acid export membrane protein